MKILWFSWKDCANPNAGGAEHVNESLAKILVKEGHEVKFIVAGYSNAKKEESVDGYTIIRLGGRLTVYIYAWIYYVQNLKGWADLVIEEINTIPFMTQWYVKEKRVLLIYQLCREIWFYEINKLIGVLGYLFEPVYLWLIRKNHVLTESVSTKKDLVKHGFSAEKIHIFPIMIDSNFLHISCHREVKNTVFTILSLGSIRPMKRTLDQIIAFEIAKAQIPELKLIVAGDNSSKYGHEIVTYIRSSQFSQDIYLLGRISAEEKIKVIQFSHIILGTSVKEGWGLTITEASTQGTPALVYDVDGLRDSVEDGITGILTNAKPDSLARKIVMLYSDKKLYEMLQINGIKKSSTFSAIHSYNDFVAVLKELL
jgi:glycosyltransferase involved in cell wall biosynthesis